jgi:tRNA-dihydrouridine synthase
MYIYSAPLEGITGHIFRANQLKYFGGVDKYFTPFITPSEKAVLGTKILRDILPENNKGQNLVPQILTNSAEGFVTMCKRLAEYGYNEFNLNLGCPSGTVVSKGRGSGFLAYPDKLDAFLNDIFKSDFKISIKTRIGIESSDEFFRLLEIYNKYPLMELIIHPRTRKDMYKNQPDWDMYDYATQNTSHKLCYNGNIFDVEDYKRFTEHFPDTDSIMIGRGMVANPALPAIIKNGAVTVTKADIKGFYYDVYDGYKEILSGSTPLMYKMKEIMSYMSASFEGSEKISKKIMKSKNIKEFDERVRELFELYELKK